MDDRRGESVVGEQTVRQVARMRAGEAHARQRLARAQRDRRLEQLAVEVLVAMAERDAAAGRTGAALQAMTTTEGLSLREAAEWCGGRLSVHEAARLRKHAVSHGPPTPARNGEQVETADTGEAAGS